MVRSSHLQSIEVSGDKLEVTTLSSETFASRKPEGTSIVELLAEVGVDHIASGLEITAKGSAARGERLHLSRPDYGNADPHGYSDER